MATPNKIGAHTSNYEITTKIRVTKTENEKREIETRKSSSCEDISVISQAIDITIKAIPH